MNISWTNCLNGWVWAASKLKTKNRSYNIFSLIIWFNGVFVQLSQSHPNDFNLHNPIYTILGNVIDLGIISFFSLALFFRCFLKWRMRVRFWFLGGTRENSTRYRVREAMRALPRAALGHFCLPNYINYDLSTHPSFDCNSFYGIPHNYDNWCCSSAWKERRDWNNEKFVSRQILADCCCSNNHLIKNMLLNDAFVHLNASPRGAEHFVLGIIYHNHIFKSN